MEISPLAFLSAAGKTLSRRWQSGLQHGRSFMLIGGVYDGDVYKNVNSVFNYDVASGSFRDMPSMAMAVARGFHVVAPVRPESVEQCGGGSTHPWVLVLGGRVAGYKDSSVAEVIRLDPENDPVPECRKNLMNLPGPRRRGAAGLIHESRFTMYRTALRIFLANTIRILLFSTCQYYLNYRAIYNLDTAILYCGGLDSIYYKSDCYAYDVANQKWSYKGRLSAAKTITGFSQHPERGLIMTGGTTKIGGDSIDAVESTANGVLFDNSHAKMPLGLSGHCQVGFVLSETLVASSKKYYIPIGHK